MSTEAPLALAATIVAVVDDEAHGEAVQTLVALRQSVAIQPVVISLGDRGDAPEEDHDGVIVYRELRARYLNNAVAALRLSSLPAVAWWRTLESHPLREMALLVDRLVLDVPDPLPQWRGVPALAALTAVSDVRWARLTRWRDLLAQFFDLPDVREHQHPFERAELTGSDPAATALFAGWLRARMPGGARLALTRHHSGSEPLEHVQLQGPAGCVTLAHLPHNACIQTSLDSTPRVSPVRVVPAGDTRLEALLRDELRIRARDVAFEDAVREAVTL